MDAGVLNESIRDESDSHLAPATKATLYLNPSVVWLGHLALKPFLIGTLTCLLLSSTIMLRLELERRMDHTAQQVTQLRFLVPGETLKPALLGFNHVGADLLWLQVIQVLGSKDIRQEDYDWLHHALNVVTTLDPHYVYAYDIGALALTEFAGRVDWGNELLEKGIAANPTAWRLPFQLGFNQFFYQQDYFRAAESMATAARLPGRPAYVPELAARLYVQGNSPELALQFLQVMLVQTHDEQARQALEHRAKEVMIERDIAHIETAMTAFFNRFGQPPQSLSELVQAKLLSAVPAEPFGGEYRLDLDHGTVTSSTHSTRLRIHSPANSMTMVHLTK